MLQPWRCFQLLCSNLEPNIYSYTALLALPRNVSESTAAELLQQVRTGARCPFSCTLGSCTQVGAAGKLHSTSGGAAPKLLQQVRPWHLKCTVAGMQQPWC